MSTALIIEDDEWAVTILRLQLESFGFAVETSRLAEDGLRRAAELRPEVILLDLMLPGMSGWEALRRLKADARLAASHVIIVSAAAGEAHGLAAGAARVLLKPIARSDLLNALTEIGVLASGATRIRLLLAGPLGRPVEGALHRLDSTRFEILRAPDAEHIQGAAETLLPDAILFDAMPHADAAQAAIARLRHTAGTFRIPIILVEKTPPPGAASARAAQHVATVVSADLDRLGPSLEVIVAQARREIGECSRPAADADRRTQRFLDRGSEE